MDSLMYNQLLNWYSKMGCVPYWIGLIFLLDYWIYVKNNFLLWVLRKAEESGVWSSTNWATFSVFYEWITKRIEAKLWIKTRAFTYNIDDILGSKRAFGFWIKKLWNAWLGVVQDDKLFIDELDLLWIKWIWHHLVWKEWYIYDPYTARRIECRWETLKEMVDRGLIWNTFRSITSSWTQSAEILHYTKRMALAEYNQRLEQYLETNKDQPWFDKAKELYFYGRT